MSIVCLDTQILIWGIRKHAEQGQESNISRAEFLLEELTSKKDTIIIPSMVYAEISINVEDSKLDTFKQEILRNFIVIPFDVSAAFHYRRLLLENKNFRKKYVDEGYSRPNQFADMQIVATSLAYNATIIYSEDPHLKKISNDSIEIKGLPPLPPVQMSLLDENRTIIQ